MSADLEPSSIWPAPREIEFHAGSWQVPAILRVDVQHKDVRLEELLDVLLPLRGAPADGTPDLVVRSYRGATGAYMLGIAPDTGVTIEAADRAGVINAVVSLKQLLPAEVWRPTPPGRGWQVPAVRIDDAPAMAWRGFMLDVARHFTPVNEVFRLLDVMAMHKLNVLHLHLSDDQGWRVESLQHPRLNDVATWRPETWIGSPFQARVVGRELTWDGTPHGGMYSQDDLRAIGAHAHRLGITVVPEIDLPGHSGALLAGIPELATSVTPARAHADTGQLGARSTVSPLHAAREILGQLLAEVGALLPGPWFHVGGDEVDLTDWREAPEVQAYLRERSLPDVDALRGEFDRYLVDVVRQLGRRPIFWDEAFASGHIDADAIVMAWRGVGIGERARAAGHDVVLAPVDPMYLDYADHNSAHEPLANGYGSSIERLAAWSPPAGGWLGVHAPVWTEYVHDVRTLHYRVFPKLSVVAAAAWTGKPTRWPSPEFQQHLRRLDAAGIEYRPIGGPHPWQRGGTGRRRFDSSVSIDVARTLLGKLSDGHEVTPDELRRLLDPSHPQ